MWEVIGFERQKNDLGETTAFTVYAVKPFKGDPGAGSKARRIWYRASEIEYVPMIGDFIIVDTETRGKYEIVTDIQKVS